jgi:hypothetical protein
MTRRLAAAAAVAVATGTLVLAGPAPAEAAACSGTSGVTVVVDYGPLGGIQVGCAAGDPSSGLAALHAAGFATTGTQKDGPAFVCRINGAPASDPCVLTPPASAYWSYWHASRGGSWAYSSLGAASYNPKPGSVEGWAFGAGGRPGISPPALPVVVVPVPAQPKPTTSPAPKLPAANPTTTPAPGAPGAPGTNPTAAPLASDAPGAPDSNQTVAPGRPGASAGRTGTSSGAPPPSASAGTASPTASASPTCTPSPSPSASPSGTRSATAVPTSDPCPPTSVATEPTSSSHQALGATALGGALVLAVALAAFLIVRRRRQTG